MNIVKTTLFASALAVTGAFMAAPAAALDGAALFKERTCFTCHGADGKTPIMPQYPKIAGQTSAYTLQQMKDIKSGARANGMSVAMKGIMHLVSDEEMQALSDYIATMQP